MLLQEKIILLLLFGISLLFKLVIIKNSQFTFFSDEAIYASFARFWAEKEFFYVFHPFWPPLYPLLSSLAFQFIPNWIEATRIVSAFSASLLVIPVYFLSRIFLDKFQSFLVSASIIFLKPIFEYSVVPLSDSLAVLLTISFLTCILYSVKNKSKKLTILSGFIVGLSFLTHSEGLLFFYLGIVFFIFQFLISQNKKQMLSKLLLYVLTFFIVISPWAISVKNQLGVWTLSAKFSAQIQQGHAFLLKDNTTWAQEVWSIKNPNYSSYLFKNPKKHVLENFSFFLFWFFEKLNVWKGILLLFFPLWFLVLALAGFVIAIKKHLLESSFLGFVLLVAIPITIFSTASNELRYLLWTVPLFIIFYFLGSQALLSSFGKEYILKVVPFLVLLTIPAFTLTIFNVRQISEQITSQNYRPELVEVASWIRKDTEKETPKIMTRHEAIEYYSKVETIYLPQGKLSEVLEYAKQKDVDYSVAWTRELSGE